MRRQHSIPARAILATLSLLLIASCILESVIPLALMASARAAEPPRIIKDCPACPELVIAPAGTFSMGSREDEPGRALNEDVVRITIERPFAIGRYAVTFDEWDACVADGACGGYRPPDVAGARGRRPVVNVSWDDAAAYVSWLSSKTGKRYRLPSESEREYATRATTTTAYWFGNDVSLDRANIDVPVTRNGTAATAVARRGSVDVDSFGANPWGLYGVHGNVWEWTADCWVDSNDAHPRDGAPVSSGDCVRRASRGGSWNDFAAEARSATRFGFDRSSRNEVQGFRVARDID